MRIVTHAGCLDGFCSAWFFKKYLAGHFNVEIDKIEVAQPRDIQEGLFEFTEKDIVLDLPEPDKYFIWFDHHSSNEPKEQKENVFWKKTPSCTSFLIDFAKENNIELPERIAEFSEAMDIIDDARYSEEQVRECFYSTDYSNLNMLQKSMMIRSLFTTRDMELNDLIFEHLMNNQNELPIDFPSLPLEIFFKAFHNSMDVWREEVNLELEGNCVVQDDRIVKPKGKVDHFYTSMKFPESAYNLLIKPLDEERCLIRIGSNIFHKDRCKVDIGALCKEVGKTFGEGSGGGHFGVGGATIFLKNADEAKSFILSKLI